MLGETKKSCDWALASLICQVGVANHFCKILQQSFDLYDCFVSLLGPKLILAHGCENVAGQVEAEVVSNSVGTNFTKPCTSINFGPSTNLRE